MTTQKRALLALCILGSTMYLAGGITTPSIAYIIDSYPNVSADFVSMLITIPGIVALFVSFFIGPLILKYNKKYLLMISVSITLLYFGIFAGVGGRGPFFALVIAAGLIGVHRGAGSALVNSAVGEFMEPEKRAVSLALCSSMMQAGGGIVAIFGGFIAAGNDGADWPLAHYIGLISIVTIVLFALLMPKKPDQANKTEIKSHFGKSQTSLDTELDEKTSALNIIKTGMREISPKVYLIMALHFAFVACMIAFPLYTSIYIISEHQLGTSVEAGLVTMTNTFFSVIVGLTYRYWGKLFGKWIVPVGYMISIAGFAFKFAVTTHIAGIWVAGMLVGVGWNLANPYVSSQIMSLSPQKIMPFSISIHLGFQNLAFFLAPFALRLFGRIFGGGLSGSLMAVIVGLIMCLGASVFLFAKREAKIDIR